MSQNTMIEYAIWKSNVATISEYKIDNDEHKKNSFTRLVNGAIKEFYLIISIFNRKNNMSFYFL